MATKNYVKIWSIIVLYIFLWNNRKIHKTIFTRKFSRAHESCHFGCQSKNDRTMNRQSIENLTRHADVSEKAIERYLVEQAKLHGMLCLKYSNPNMVGYPDRLLVLPGGGVAWVELKSKGRKPTRIQQMRIAELTGMGHLVRVIDNKHAIDELINDITI